MGTLSTVMIAAALFAYLLYRQSIRRLVTRGDLALPVIGALYLSTRYFNDATVATIVIMGATAFGIVTGLASGAFVRVWREGEGGQVYQYGGWRYVTIALAFIAVRLALRAVVRAAHLPIDAATLNDAFIAMMISSFLGRALIVGSRALALIGGDLDLLPSRREVRRTYRAARHSDR